jgi:hypothetical protein
LNLRAFPMTTLRGLRARTADPGAFKEAEFA